MGKGIALSEATKGGGKPELPKFQNRHMYGVRRQAIARRRFGLTKQRDGRFGAPSGGCSVRQGKAAWRSSAVALWAMADRFLTSRRSPHTGDPLEMRRRAIARSRSDTVAVQSSASDAIPL